MASNMRDFVEVTEKATAAVSSVKNEKYGSLIFKNNRQQNIGIRQTLTLQ
jgi:hypothetical protein